jgi:hypothetical protein
MFWAILTPEEHVIDALLRLNADIAVMARKDRAIGAIMSNTHSPPVRRSIRRVLQEKPSGPHQCGSVSELTQAPQTADTGALIARFRII